MSDKKQFGVWMDSHSATVIARETSSDDDFTVVGHVSNPGAEGNSNENTKNNHERGLTQKFFKEIAALMQNVDEIHITGTGDSQEQFIKFLSETPQYKNTVSSESTSNKMTEEKLIALITEYFK